MTNSASFVRALSAALILLFITSANTYGENIALLTVAPESVGVDSQGIENLSKGMSKTVEDGNVAGIVTMMARNGKVVHFEAAGYQDIENQVTMKKDTIFRIFSMTKPVTGVALSILLEQGKFKLSDPVASYIPEFANLKVAKAEGPDGMPILEDAHHKMTIQELMSHTGGLTYGFFSQSQTDTLYQQAGVLDQTGTLKDMIDKLAKLPLRQQPGSAWHYSVSVDVQGYLVEVLSGKRFDVFLQDEIFNPLGMTDTGFSVAPENAGRLARNYTPANGKLVSRENSQYLKPATFFSGGGGLTSTATDYMKFAQMLANGGELNGVRILSEDSVALLRTNKLPPDIEDIGGFFGGNQFGLDVAIVTDSKKNAGMSVGSYWWWGVAGTWFWVDPVENVVFVGMIQNMALPVSRGIHASSERLVYSSLIKNSQ